MSRFACRDCEMVFAWPMPDARGLAAYNAAYFESAHGGAPASRVARAFHSAVNMLRVNHVERHGPAPESITRVLEIGPGHGEFAAHWLRRHPGTAYDVVESDASCLPGLCRLGARVSADLPQVLAGGDAWDLIVLSHVLEHTAAPYDFLAPLVERLRPGGALFVEVPCRDWEHKRVDEPHLLFFDKRPMERLLSRLGLAGARLSYHGRGIDALRREGKVARGWLMARTRLLEAGIVAPFAARDGGLAALEPLERAAARLYDAHREHDQPAWWLRAIAFRPGEG